MNLSPAHAIVTNKGGEIMDGLNELQPLMQRSRLNKLLTVVCKFSSFEGYIATVSLSTIL